MARGRRHQPHGKRIVYITQHRNSAVEVMKMYQRKGHNTSIERENDATGQILFVVYAW